MFVQGKSKKKLELEVPQLDIFIHKVYVECARKLYKNVFLFEMDILPIQKQKYKRDIDNLIRESITDVIRVNMPIENILKAYLDETCEQDIYEDIEESFENIGEDLPTSVLTSEITDIKQTPTTNEIEVDKSNTTSSVSISVSKPNLSTVVVENKTPIDTSTEISSSSQPSQQIDDTQNKKEVQFIGDFKENEPSGYLSSESDASSLYPSDNENDADNEDNDFKLKIGVTADNVLSDITDLGTPKSLPEKNEIKLDFEELK